MLESRFNNKGPRQFGTWSFTLIMSIALCPPALSAETAIPDNPRLIYEEPTSLTGAIYAREARSEDLLFRFKRVATRSGSTLDVLREYTYPDGKPAAREHVVYEGNALAVYELEELQTGATGNVKIERDPKHPAKTMIAFQYTHKASAGANPAVKREPLPRDTLINDMVGPFLAAHCELLLRGEKVTCRCVVLSRKETVGFSFIKESESKWRGQDVLILKMEPTSIFISALVDPLIFTIEKAPPHRVLQYVGRTTPKIAEGRRWQNLDAVTVFDW
jgi:hypothetical protein